MSDSKKPGGSRDISELKQRLGLKKGAAAQTSGSGSTARVNGAGTGGVVPPPGLNLPPPPGVQQPSQPPAPAIPDAADDPFGAMNAMATRQAAVPRAPEIVIVNDGRPVENVGASSTGATLAKLLLPALAALGIGVGVGRISKDANFYNEGLSGARSILGDAKSPSTVSGLKKLVADLEVKLDEMKTKTNYHPDKETDTALTALATKLDVKSELVFRAKENSLDAETAGQILSFYAGVAEIKSMLDAHNKASLGDDIALKAGKQKADDATLKETDNALLAGQAKYGVLIQSPSETDKSAEFGAKVVELSGVYCGTAATPVAKCGEQESPSAFAYRNEPGGTPTKGDLVTSGSDNVPTRKLVMLLPNGIRDALIKGSEPSASEVLYVKRIAAIAARTKKLLDDGNKLEQKLQAEANKGNRFSFFM